MPGKKKKFVIVERPKPQESNRLKYIDLFCGIGGFHQALREMGAECMLACDKDKYCRQVYEMNYDMHNMKWSRKIGREIKNKNVVIFGYGQIGRKVSSLLEAFGAKIYFVDPHIDNKNKPENLISKEQKNYILVQFLCLY